MCSKDCPNRKPACQSRCIEIFKQRAENAAKRLYLKRAVYIACYDEYRLRQAAKTI
jgi:hypothetical protein